MPQTIFEDADGALAMLRASVEAFAERYPGPETLRAKRAAGGDLARPVWTAMAEAGWTGLLLPESLGGLGLGLAEQAVLSEALGRALICEPLATIAVFSGKLLANAPASPERDRLSAGLISGEAIVAPVASSAGTFPRRTARGRERRRGLSPDRRGAFRRRGPGGDRLSRGRGDDRRGGAAVCIRGRRGLFDRDKRRRRRRRHFLREVRSRACPARAYPCRIKGYRRAR